MKQAIGLIYWFNSMITLIMGAAVLCGKLDMLPIIKYTCGIGCVLFGLIGLIYIVIIGYNVNKQNKKSIHKSNEEVK